MTITRFAIVPTEESSATSLAEVMALPERPPERDGPRRSAAARSLGVSPSSDGPVSTSYTEIGARIGDAVAELVRAEVESAVSRVGNADDEIKLMTLTEAARFARVSVKMIRRWIVAGDLRHRRAGRRIVVDRRDVLRCMPENQNAVDGEVARLLREVK